MKKLIFSTVFIAVFSFTALAQDGTGFGIKGGLNYNANGDYFESIGDNAQHPDRNVGYHLGVFGKFGDRFYFRPELVYTSTKSEYNSDDFKMKKLDAPMLIGIKVLGPINVFGGPAFQYILDTEFDGVTINDVENEFTVGLNFGIGLDLNKVGIDLRYERGFNNNEATFINNNFGGASSRIDTRPDQLILSLSLKL
ncbi:outer membrane protein with beta-barrel domain [Flavobacteriaceae bacterium MAR_2010_72]|nr:outer membrane protein with beta-barrel domain [Flavobacteriaceae bacterium MAR_2010_72]TVZ59376.1 outer membrane protein with beta-barrel domain [Flavobacteriaceae bacterium MAR_2010_105]